MEFLLLNEEFETIDFVEGFDSLIWTERYFSPGDFELLIGLTPSIISRYRMDYYLYCNESDHVMILEDLNIDSKVTKESQLVVTGRSLESILDRRIVRTLTRLNGNLQSIIQQLLNSNVISPSNTDRRISNFIFETSTDPLVTSATVDVQVKGENLLEIISSLCETTDLGFKITLNSSNNFVFKLYAGVDRSYDQWTKPQVTFSPNFDNIGDSKYLTSKRNYKTTMRVDGEGEEDSPTFVDLSRSDGAKSGLSRREGYVQSNATSDNGAVPPATYTKLLQLDGARALGDASITSVFDGEALMTPTFDYRQDFFMGDIVQLEADYVSAASAKVRVLEFIRSKNPSGDKAYPTLKSV